MDQKPKGKARDRVKIITGLIGTGLLVVFILGLSHSISTGFAGFEGGLPFLVISVFVLLLALWDYIDECLRKR